MIRSNGHRNPVIYFSRWIRKGYAVFVALGKEVAFAAVPIHVCEQALLKSAKKGVVVRETDYVKECVLREEAMYRMVGTGYRTGAACADADSGNSKNECTTVTRYAVGRRTSFLC